MKPSDHAEFFRRAAPAGASRESSIVLLSDGEILHEGQPVENRALWRALHAWVDRHPENHRVILQNGYDWCFVGVESVPCFVETVRSGPDGDPVATFLGGQEAPVRDVWQDATGSLFMVSPRAGLPARFLRLGQLELAPWLAELDGDVSLVLRDGRVRIEVR